MAVRREGADGLSSSDEEPEAFIQIDVLETERKLNPFHATVKRRTQLDVLVEEAGSGGEAAQQSSFALALPEIRAGKV